MPEAKLFYGIVISCDDDFFDDGIEVDGLADEQQDKYYELGRDNAEEDTVMFDTVGCETAQCPDLAIYVRSSLQHIGDYCSMELTQSDVSKMSNVAEDFADKIIEMAKEYGITVDKDKIGWVLSASG